MSWTWYCFGWLRYHWRSLIWNDSAVPFLRAFIIDTYTSRKIAESYLLASSMKLRLSRYSNNKDSHCKLNHSPIWDNIRTHIITVWWQKNGCQWFQRGQCDIALYWYSDLRICIVDYFPWWRWWGRYVM